MPKRRHQNISAVSSDEEDSSDESYEVSVPSTSHRVTHSQVTRGSKTSKILPFLSQPADVSSKQRVLTQLGSQLTDFEKEIIIDKVLKRIVSKYLLTQKTFRKTAMFLPEDKIKPKQQDSLIPMIKEKLKEYTKLELVTDGSRFMVSIPKALQTEILSQNHPSQSTEHKSYNSGDAENSLCSQPVQPPDDITHVLLTITLAVIYFYRGKILEDELIEKRLPQILPIINSFFLSSKDLTKTMQDFEQRAFIEKKMSISDPENPPKVYVYWGFRAKTEVDKKMLLPVYCQLADCTTNDLPLWLKEAIESDVDF
ncbi:uncharacterized protein LOC106660965 [Cimex lectularius]|uniref:MAGE domain-containing protein n=1 Tax=Cimex lectularius TaxID=79782 RepID=A0A8I6R912_CIMLE|nr:uncharacterized protein LOC106660965 [Cimex lectularius]XP_014239530.1 uncharacterized protein LOC106660965 [Cimex lectularius]